MIERIIEQQEAIRIIFASDRKTAHLVLTWQHMDVLEPAVLCPLCKFTDLLAGEKRVTVSAIIPMLNHIEDTILANKPGETNLTSEIKARIKSDIDSQYNDDTRLFLHVCTFLVPCFKLAQESNTSIKEAVKQIVKKELEQACQPTIASSAPQNSSSDPPTKVYKTAWGKYLAINSDMRMLLSSHCHNV